MYSSLSSEFGTDAEEYFDRLGNHETMLGTAERVAAAGLIRSRANCRETFMMAFSECDSGFSTSHGRTVLPDQPY